MRSNRHSDGFTLMELMITLLIASVLATAAIPGFSSLIKKNRISTYTNNLVTSLALARSEAVKRGMLISLCASSNGFDCTNTSFQQGWIVFTDQGTSGRVDGTDTVLRIQEAAAGLRFTITGNAIVQYLPSGVLYTNTRITGYEWLAEAAPVPRIQNITLHDFLFNLMPGSAAHASDHMADDTPTDDNQLPGTPSDPLRTGITNFDICTSGTSGESGILVIVSITGRISTQNITCS